MTTKKGNPAPPPPAEAFEPRDSESAVKADEVRARQALATEVEEEVVVSEFKVTFLPSEVVVLVSAISPERAGASASRHLSDIAAGAFNVEGVKP